jgi:hypothetical protein
MQEKAEGHEHQVAAHGMENVPGTGAEVEERGRSGKERGGRSVEAFVLEAGRRRVALQDEDEDSSLFVGENEGASDEDDGGEDAPDVHVSGDASDFSDTSLHAGAAAAAAAGEVGVDAEIGEDGEVEEDLVQPPRCDSPEVPTAGTLKGRCSSAGRLRKASAISAAEQSLDSASALVAPQASLSLFSRGGRPGTSGRAPSRALFALQGVAEENAGGERVEAKGVRGSVGSGVHSVGEALALPAGARGLGTPTSLRRAAKFAETLFDDSFDNGDVFAKADEEDRDKGLPVDKSLSGASFLVSMQKAAKAAGLGEGARALGALPAPLGGNGVFGAGGGMRASHEGAYDAGGALSARGAGGRGRGDGGGGGGGGTAGGLGGGGRPVSASKVTTNRLRAAEDGEIDYLLKKFVDARGRGARAANP